MEKTIQPEELQRFLDMMRKQPVQIMPTDGDDRERQAERLIDNMRWAGLTDRLDDIRDLLYINAVQNSAVLEVTTHYNEELIRVIQPAIKESKKVLDMMHKRNEKSKKHIESLMAEYDAIMRGKET